MDLWWIRRKLKFGEDPLEGFGHLGVDADATDLVEELDGSHLRPQAGPYRTLGI